MGVLPTDEARRIAAEKGFDLIEVAPEATPPVCRLMDYGKYKYQLRKKSQKSKKKAHVVRLKELRLRPITDEHDVEIKIRHARELLEKGDKVMFTIFFKGREVVHMTSGHELLAKIEAALADIAKTEAPVRREGSRLFLNLVKK